MDESRKPMTVEEVEDLLKVCLHGPLPQPTVYRMMATLAEWRVEIAAVNAVLAKHDFAPTLESPAAEWVENLCSNAKELQGDCIEMQRELAAAQRDIADNLVIAQRFSDEIVQTAEALAKVEQERAEALGTYGGGERCQSCGRMYSTVWTADDALWERVTGAKSLGGGLFCPLCFMREAADESLHWSVGSGRFVECVLDDAVLEERDKAVHNLAEAERQLEVVKADWGKELERASKAEHERDEAYGTLDEYCQEYCPVRTECYPLSTKCPIKEHEREAGKSDDR